MPAEGDRAELVVGKPACYSKSAKEEIESDKIDILYCKRKTSGVNPRM